MTSSTLGPEGDRLGPLLARRLDRRSIAVLRRVGRAAASANQRAFLVGGVVRDLLIGLPLRDLDVAVEGEVFELARQLGGDVREYRAFGTATIDFADGLRIDLASTRRERYPAPAALPRVEPADLREDLGRRDFTINAMALSLEPGRFGGLIDTKNGCDDLSRGILRVLHDRSFLDDPTRAFRAVRFAVRLGFRIEAHTAGLLDAARGSGVFDRLSSTRLRRELRLCFSEQHLERIARELDRHRLFAVVGDPLGLDAGRRAALRRVDAAVARQIAPDAETWVVVIGIMLLRHGDTARRRVLDRLQPERRARRVLERAAREIARLVRGLRSVPRLRASLIHGFCRDVPVETLLIVLASTPERRVHTAVRRFLVDLRGVRTAIRGDDLIRAGVRRGPAVALGLDAALAARLDGRAATASRQLAVALEAIGAT